MISALFLWLAAVVVVTKFC